MKIQSKKNGRKVPSEKPEHCVVGRGGKWRLELWKVHSQGHYTQQQNAERQGLS